MSAANSDMRVVIAGAGGRMGRTLIHAIAATKGITLSGAAEFADSAVIGRDVGELAGLGPNGIKIVSDVAPLLAAADGLIEFAIPAATLALAELTAAAGIVHVIGTTGHSAEEEVVNIAKAASRAAIVKSGNMSLGVIFSPPWSSASPERSTRTTTSKFWRCITTGRSTRRQEPRSCSAEPPPPAAASISPNIRCAAATA